MHRYLSILFLIFTIVKPSFSIAEEQEISKYMTSWRLRATLKTQGNFLDISDLVKQIKETPKESPYEENLNKLKEIEEDLQQSGEIYQIIANLCKESTECIENATARITETSQQVRQEMKEMILVPQSYLPVNFLNSATLNIHMPQIQQALDCGQCSDRLIANNILSGSDQVYSEVYNKLKSKGKDCIVMALHKLFEKVEKIRIPEECLKEENKNDFVCQTINEDMKIRQDRIADLTALFDQYNPSNAESDVCLPPNFRTSWGIDDMQNFLNETQTEQMCQSLEPGEEKEFFHLNPIKILIPFKEIWMGLMLLT